VELTDTNWSTGLFFLAIQLFTWEPNGKQVLIQKTLAGF
jgi:hypothetical protein